MRTRLGFGAIVVGLATVIYAGAQEEHRLTVPPLAPGDKVVLEVAETQEGWSSFAQAEGAHTFYVSSSTGSDSNLGDSPDKPVRSIARATKLLRGGRGDWLLLRAGDSWDESFGVWAHSGESAAHPTLISSYGEGPRPVIRPGKEQGFRIMNRPVEHLALVGLHFAAPEDPHADRHTGLGILGPIDGLLIEDCLVEGFNVNIGLNAHAGPIKNVVLRRSIMIDSITIRKGRNGYAPGHSQGLFANGVEGLTVDECVLDRNGWRPGVEGGQTSKFSHNVYIQYTCRNVAFRNTITARSSNTGIMMRPGGIVEGNFVLSNPSGISFGSRKGEGDLFDGVVRDNVLLHGSDADDAVMGWGIGVKNLDDVLVENNILAHVRTKGTGQGISISDTVWNAIVRNNVVYEWGSGIRAGATELKGITIADNLFVSVNNQRAALIDIRMPSAHSDGSMVFSGNRYWTTARAWFKADGKALSSDTWAKQFSSEQVLLASPSLPDPRRTIETYMDSLGEDPTMDAFLTQARAQSKARWRKEFTASVVNTYFRDGYFAR